MEGAAGGQFLDQIVGRGWRLRRIVVKRGGELILMDQIHIHMEKAFHDRGSFVAVRMRQLLIRRRVEWLKE